MILCTILRKACSRAKALSFHSEVNSSGPALSSFPAFTPTCTPHDKRKGPHFHHVFAEDCLYISYCEVKGGNGKFAKFKMTLPHGTSSSLSLQMQRGGSLLTRTGAGRSPQQGAGPQQSTELQFSYLGWWAPHDTQDGDSNRKLNLGNRPVS